MSVVKRLVFSALFCAIGVALPYAFHSVPEGGQVFLPMHLPVLLCGLVCGWPFGLACGALAPLLSHMLSGMPPAALLPAMVIELAAYGFFAGLFLPAFRSFRRGFALYAALICAMLAGRVVFGVANALFFGGGDYSLGAWLTASFVTALPGIGLQLVLIPALFAALEKSGLTARRGGKYI